jgi:hypothetical protein
MRFFSTGFSLEVKNSFSPFVMSPYAFSLKGTSQKDTPAQEAENLYFWYECYTKSINDIQAH